MMDYASVDALHADLRLCRQCADAGYHIEGSPVYSGKQSARLMLIGQAPGPTEVERHYPFAGDAGQRLFGWLKRAGWDEQTFRQTCYMTSVTKCFPGRNPKGEGDRVPSAAEQKLCRPWLDAELRLVQPEVIVPVGRLAISLFFPTNASLTDVIGEVKRDERGCRIVPLPHPSGASRWLNDRENLGRLENAIYQLSMLRIELKL